MKVMLLCLFTVIFLPSVVVTRSSPAAAAPTAAANLLADSATAKQRLPLANDLQLADFSGILDSDYTEEQLLDDVDNQAGAVKRCQAGYKPVNDLCGKPEPLKCISVAARVLSHSRSGGINVCWHTFLYVHAKLTACHQYQQQQRTALHLHVHELQHL
jgi:hypothetical protein